MSQPLVGLTLLYIGGIVTGDWVPLAPRPCVVSLVGLSALCWCLSAGRPWLLWLLVFAAGSTNLNVHTAITSRHDLRLLAAQGPEEVMLRGRLRATPEIRILARDDQISARTLATLAISGFKRGNNDWVPACGKVLVTTPEPLPRQIYAGRIVHVAGTLLEPPRALASGLFDYRHFLLRQGIHYQLKAPSSQSWRTMDEHPAAEPWSDRFLRWAKPTLALGFPEEDPAIQLIWAMALGWKPGLSGDLSEPFMRSGTMHVFAVSGLHISLISVILVALLRTVGMPRAWCGMLVIPAIWFYTAAIGGPASAVRSTVMMTIIIAGWSLRRPPDLLNSLAAAALLLLLADPQQLFQAGFQLSFFVVLSLALIAPILQKLAEPIWQRDPLRPAVAVPWWRLKLLQATHYLAASLATSLAAWLGSIPLVAHYFHYFTPVSLLANLLVVPLSALALMSASGSLLVGSFAPWLAMLFNHSAWLWMKLMIWCSAWAADLPGAWSHVAGPSAYTFVLYYLLLVLVLTGWLFRRRSRGVAGSCLVLVTGVWLYHWRCAAKVTEITLLPLNGGEALYLHGGPLRQSHLIDCGGERPARTITAPFLRAQGVQHLDTFTLTHGQAQNVAGAGIIVDLFKPQTICTSPANFRSPIYREVRQQLSDRVRLQTVDRGDFIGPWRVLHPSTQDAFASADDAALVLSGDFAGTKLLLLSDLGRRGQETLFRHVPDLRADIVVSGLPSNSEPLVEAFLAAVEPRVIVVTDAEFPARARASRKLRGRLAAYPGLVLYTRETGAITISFSKGGWTIRTVSGQEYRKENSRPKGQGEMLFP